MTVGGRPKRAAVADFRLGGVYVGEALLGRELTGLQPLPDLLHHGGIAGASHNREAALNPVDLQEDRICAPYAVRGSRRLATIDAVSLYSCGFSALLRLDSAWLSEAVFGRLLPVCCPG